MIFVKIRVNGDECFVDVEDCMFLVSYLCEYFCLIGIYVGCDIS